MDSSNIKKCIAWLRTYIFVRIAAPESALTLIFAPIVLMFLFIKDARTQLIYIFCSIFLLNTGLYKYMTKKHRDFLRWE